MNHFEEHAEVIDRQGWTDDTLLSLADRFIRERGLIDQFGEWLEVLAEEENEPPA